MRTIAQVIEGFPRLQERASIKLAEARRNGEPEPLFIRPSAQWYACEGSQGSKPLDKPNLDEAMKDEFGIWHVCYSMHSSREELESSLRVLRPKWVISTTPPCRAMELDYVKKHCYKTKMTPDDPLWKLLKLGTGKFISSASSNVAKATTNTDTGICEETASAECTQDLQVEMPMVSLEVQMDSPQEEVPITLFGRARMGLPEPYYVSNGTETSTELVVSNEMQCIIPESKMTKTIISNEAQCVVSCPKPSDIINSRESHCVVSELETWKTSIASNEVQADENCKDFNPGRHKEELVFKESNHSSRIYSSNLRGLYRSMNVPVPQPLPSLVKLMSSSKRARVGPGIV